MDNTEFDLNQNYTRLNLTGVCAKSVVLSFDTENKLSHLEFTGGCKGNLTFISKLLIGKTKEEIIELCKGNICGSKQTSCVDQLSKVLQSL